MRMGSVCRFTLVVNRRLWPEAMSFLLTSDMLPTVWWTAHPADSLTLTGWVGGPRSAELLALSHGATDRRGLGVACRNSSN